MAKKRRHPARKSVRKRSSNAAWGHYLFCDFGLSVAYVAKADADETVEAALFGVDTWCSGLIACHGRQFGSKEAFKEAMQALDASYRLGCPYEALQATALLAASLDALSQPGRARRYREEARLLVAQLSDSLPAPLAARFCARPEIRAACDGIEGPGAGSGA